MASNSLEPKFDQGDFLVVLQALIKSNQKIMEQALSNLQARQGSILSQAEMTEFQNSMLYLTTINRLAKECANDMAKFADADGI